ncbi:hypothetical protein EVAR_21649_1 [Eumeta japonica]|uniref:Uncharacterized protein n=1 Tax=Eumeta variegata TaxID=151549 RepID=A0A4C1VFZ7_EUMVA|nr:hypothetical protein EVAR_21649_1 [Eumeta japonica]
MEKRTCQSRYWFQAQSTLGSDRRRALVSKLILFSFPVRVPQSMLITAMIIITLALDLGSKDFDFNLGLGLMTFIAYSISAAYLSRLGPRVGCITINNQNPHKSTFESSDFDAGAASQRRSYLTAVTRGAGSSQSSSPIFIFAYAEGGGPWWRENVLPDCSGRPLIGVTASEPRSHDCLDRDKCSSVGGDAICGRSKG